MIILIEYEKLKMIINKSVWFSIRKELIFLKLDQYIVLSKNKCGECNREYYELQRKPLEQCPYCKEEMTILNSEKTGEKFVKIQIDVKTGNVKMLEKKRF